MGVSGMQVFFHISMKNRGRYDENSEDSGLSGQNALNDEMSIGRP